MLVSVHKKSHPLVLPAKDKTSFTLFVKSFLCFNLSFKIEKNISARVILFPFPVRLHAPQLFTWLGTREEEMG